MIKILLVDDHKIILDSLGLLFNLMDDIQLLGTLSDSRKVLDFMDEHPVDILITDLTMPYINGIDLSFKVKERFPQQKIIMLTVNDSPDLILDAYKAGISGYVMKKAGKDELEKAIKSVYNGELHFSNEVMKLILSGQQADVNRDKTKLLTKREIEIVKLMVQEKSSAEIAKELFISLGTVETHRHNIFKKIGVKNVVGVVKFALKYNLVDE